MLDEVPDEVRVDCLWIQDFGPCQWEGWTDPCLK